MSVITLEQFRNETIEKTVDDYHIPATVPFTQDHVEIHKTFYWNANLKPEWFRFHHLGLDYDCTRLRERHELEEISSKGDLQKQRFKQNAKKNDIKKDCVSPGKDIRCKGLIVVKDRSTGEIVLKYIQDGNTLYAIGKELDFPNYICIEFWINENWTPSNAIAIGVNLNLLEKHNGPATEEDIENALREISESEEFVELMKDVDKNHENISERLLNYYGSFRGVQLKGDEAGATVIKIINSIIYGKDPVKTQNLNPTVDIVLKQMIKQGYTDNDVIIFSALAYHPEKLLLQHLKKRTKDAPYSTTRVGVALYKSGSVSHEKYWWIKNAKVMIDKIEDYIEWNGPEAPSTTRLNLVGVYQNHVGTDHRFALGTVVSIQEIKNWHKELTDQGLI